MIVLPVQTEGSKRHLVHFKGSVQEGKNAKTFTIVSLFSGCGGMDLGFRGGFSIFGRKYKKNPFNIIWANEINEAACRTYRSNVGKEIHCGDIHAYFSTLPRNADVVIGGFPC